MSDIETSIERWRPRRRRDQLVPGPSLIVSRGLLYLALFLVGTAVIWACVTSVDVTVEARGEIDVEGEAIELTVPSAALVTGIEARVGQKVHTGDVLLTLDTAAERAEIDRIGTEIESLRQQVDRYRDGAIRLDQAKRLLADELSALERIAGLAEQVDDRNRALAAKGIIASADVTRSERNLLEARARYAEKRGSEERLSRSIEEDRRRALETELKIDELQLRVDELDFYVDRASLRSPVSGTIIRMALRHPGSFVGTDEPAVVLAPDGAELQARVEIPNASMRRLSRGARAKVTFDAFPREDYGAISGRLLQIEPDANESGNFRALLSLEEADFVGQSLRSQLKPGLHLTARIVTERRRLIEYLLRPIDRLSRPLSVVQ